MNLEIGYENVVKVPEEGITRTKNDIAVPSGISSDKKNRIDRVLIPESCLKRRIHTLAQEICKNIGVSFLGLPQILHHFQQFPPTDILKLGYHIQSDRVND